MTKSKSIFILAVLIIISVLFILRSSSNTVPENNIDEKVESNIISGSFDESRFMADEQWKEILTPNQYYILREQGTERPYTGKLNDEKRAGTYYSVGCDQAVFRSETKYDSKTGWPSFWAPISEDDLVLRTDYDLGYERIEVLDKCGGHLGHVFDDGPEPTGKRYCINSEALYFVPDEE